MTILDKIIESKIVLAKLYLDNLSDRFIKPLVDDDSYDVYHIFNIRHKDRGNLKKYHLKIDIMPEIHYPLPPHLQKSMDNIIEGKYSISEEVHYTSLSLPISYFHTKENVLTVCEVKNNWNGWVNIMKGIILESGSGTRIYRVTKRNLQAAIAGFDYKGMSIILKDAKTGV